MGTMLFFLLLSLLIVLLSLGKIYRNIGYDQNDYYVIDTETTGLHPEICHILEVAIIHVRNNAIIEKTNDYFNPCCGILSSITRINGITQEMIKDQPKFYENGQFYLNMLTDKVIVGHNAKFDLDFMEQELGENIRCKYIDTLEIARELFPDRSSKSLASLCQRLRISDIQTHRALDDARMTADLFEKLKPLMKRKRLRIENFIHQTQKVYEKTRLPSADPNHPGTKLEGKEVVFTGIFREIYRRRLMQLAANQGAKVMSMVSNSTDIAVIGDKPSKEIMSLLDKRNASGIKQVNESEFIKMIL